MKTVVVLSGGMDSAVLLYHLRASGHQVVALSVHYGQRHSRELSRAEALCLHAEVPWTLVDLSGLRTVMKGSSQTDSVDVPEGHYADETMRLTVVPNRNMILIGVAAAHAISLGFSGIAYGAHAGDHAIYPDCRPEFVAALANALELCDYNGIALRAPFLNMTKGDIAILGKSLKVPFELTWTCYKGGDLACGKCGSCTERLEAFQKAGISDPLEYAK